MEPPRPNEGSTPRSLLVQLLAGLTASVGAWVLMLRLWTADPRVVQWADRDLLRAARVFLDWPVTGAEMNYGVGARVPGGAYAWLLALPVGLGAGDQAVYAMMVAADGVAGLLLGWLVARHHGSAAGAATLAVYASTSGARRAMAWLWNPAMLPLLVVLGIVGLHGTVTDGRTRHTLLWAGSLALAAQMHMTGAVWLAATAVGLTLVRRWPGPRHAAVAAGVVALAYAHYLIGEVARAWPNGRAMGEQWLGLGGTGGDGDRGQQLLLAVSYLLPALPRPLEGLAAPGWAVGALALLGAAHAWSGARANAALAATAVVALGVAVAVVTPALGSHIHVEWRYLLVAVPGFAVLAGVGVAGIQARAPGWLVGPATVAALALCVASPAASLTAWPTDDGGVLSTRGHLALRARLRAEHGFTDAELSGRLMFAEEDDDGRWHFMDPMPAELQAFRAGDAFTGSQSPPCLAVFRGSSDDVTVTDLAAVLGVSEASLSVTRTRLVDPALTVLTYVPADGRCRSTATNRYVDTAVEAAMRPAWDTLAPNTARAQALADGTPLLVAALATDLQRPRENSLLAGVVLRREGDDLVATLHSNQLRGVSYNDGWLHQAHVSRPRLVLRGDDGREHTLVWHEGVVGRSGVITPLAARLTVPAARYDVTLRLEAMTLPEEALSWPLPPMQAVPFEAALGAHRL